MEDATEYLDAIEGIHWVASMSMQLVEAVKPDPLRLIALVDNMTRDQLEAVTLAMAVLLRELKEEHDGRHRP